MSYPPLYSRAMKFKNSRPVADPFASFIALGRYAVSRRRTEIRSPFASRTPSKQQSDISNQESVRSRLFTLVHAGSRWFTLFFLGEGVLLPVVFSVWGESEPETTNEYSRKHTKTPTKHTSNKKMVLALILSILNIPN